MDTEKVKDDSKKKDNKDGWLIGGPTLIGVGVGFILLHYSVFFFIGAVVIGVGIGLLLEGVIARK